MNGGQRLRALRESLGLTVRDVQAASEKLAERNRNDEFSLTKSTLSDIESKGILPGIFKIYTLAAIYKRDVGELLSFYGIDLDRLPAEMVTCEVPKTQFIGRPRVSSIRMPVQLEPGFDLRETTDFSRLIAEWGVLPISMLARLENSDFALGYIGMEDTTMYPLIVPGSFVQIDPSRTKIEQRKWLSDYDRPIYFLETRGGYECGWCSLDAGMLILEPHSMSGRAARIYRTGIDVDIVGQVVGVAMRLDARSERPVASPLTTQKAAIRGD